MNILKILKETNIWKKLPSMQRVRLQQLDIHVSLNAGGVISRKQKMQRNTENNSLGFIETVH